MNKDQVRKLKVGDKLIHLPSGSKVLGLAKVVYLQEIQTDLAVTNSRDRKGMILIRVCSVQGDIPHLIRGFTVNAVQLMPFVPQFWERLQAATREMGLLRQVAQDYMEGNKQVERSLLPAGREDFELRPERIGGELLRPVGRRKMVKAGEP